MEKLENDLIINAINNQIKRSIELVIDNGCYAAAVILIFAGIDAMANIGRPEGQKYSNAEDFKVWINKFFHINGQTKISPEEWWAARNAIIHTFGVQSKAHENPKIRTLGWMVNSIPYIRYNEKVAPSLILVDIIAMRDSFIKGMYKFLTQYFADPQKKKITERRLQDLLQSFTQTRNA